MKPKPCPHCKCKDVYVVIDGVAYVECSRCFARGPRVESSSPAIRLWNRRAKG
jgi:Lar family restriction alleviation protein